MFVVFVTIHSVPRYINRKLLFENEIMSNLPFIQIDLEIFFFTNQREFGLSNGNYDPFDTNSFHPRVHAVAENIRKNSPQPLSSVVDRKYLVRMPALENGM